MSRTDIYPALRRTIAIVLALASGAAEAASPSAAEMKYVTLRAGGLIVRNSCWGQVDQTGAIRRYGQKTGIDFATFDAAIVAAYRLRRNKPHNADALIPAVTERVNAVSDQIASDIATDRTKACDAWQALLNNLDRRYPPTLMQAPF